MDFSTSDISKVEETDNVSAGAYLRVSTLLAQKASTESLARSVEAYSHEIIELLSVPLPDQALDESKKFHDVVNKVINEHGSLAGLKLTEAVDIVVALMNLSRVIKLNRAS